MEPRFISLGQVGLLCVVADNHRWIAGFTACQAAEGNRVRGGRGRRIAEYNRRHGCWFYGLPSSRGTGYKGRGNGDDALIPTAVGTRIRCVVDENHWWIAGFTAYLAAEETGTTDLEISDIYSSGHANTRKAFEKLKEMNRDFYEHCETLAILNTKYAPGLKY